MPLPSPKGKQDKETFVSNCMSNETMKKEYPDSKQRVAVCYSKWRQSKGTTEIDFTEQIRQLKADEKAGYPPNCNKGYEEKDGKCVLIKKDKDSTAKG